MIEKDPLRCDRCGCDCVYTQRRLCEACYEAYVNFPKSQKSTNDDTKQVSDEQEAIKILQIVNPSMEGECLKAMLDFRREGDFYYSEGGGYDEEAVYNAITLALRRGRELEQHKNREAAHAYNDKVFQEDIEQREQAARTSEREKIKTEMERSAENWQIVEAVAEKREDAAWDAARLYFDNPKQSGIEIEIPIEKRWKYLSITDWRRKKEGEK